MIGIPDSIYGEEIKVYCVLEKSEVIGEEAIIACCKQKLPGFKVPKQVKIIDMLPENLLGKLLRAELRKMDREKSA